MKNFLIKQITVYFCQDQYDLTEILGDSIQVYGNKVFVSCLDPDNDVLEDMIGSVVHVTITAKQKEQIATAGQIHIVNDRAKMRLFTPEIPSNEFGLRPHLVFEFKKPLIIDEDD